MSERLKGYIRANNDAIEADFCKNKISYKLEWHSEYDEYTKILEKNYGLGETAGLELYSKSSVCLNYDHLENRDWSGHTILNRVFDNKEVCMRSINADSDRLFVIRGADTGTALEFFFPGRCVIFLRDLSFLLIDHDCYNIVYDGVRNEFYNRADKLMRDFYKKPSSENILLNKT